MAAAYDLYVKFQKVSFTKADETTKIYEKNIQCH